MENTTTPTRPMNKALLMILALLLVGGVLVLGRFIPQPKPMTQPRQGAQDTVPTVEAQVVITKNGFLPATLLIRKGTMVTWKNTDTAPHRVASDPFPSHTDLPDLDSLDPLHHNDTYSFTFQQTGKFGYTDHLNPHRFHGTIIVQ